MATRPSLCIVTPALADANNGNWQTAHRWARLLSGHYRVRLARQWPDGPEPQADLLVALHARRSAASIAAWAAARPGQPLVVVLTGTDLYRDIATDTQAQRSLDLATRLVVLQSQAPADVPVPWRDKCRVVFQSSTRRAVLPKTGAHLRAVMVGHLRDEKWPQTLFDAAHRLRPDEGILIDHIGLALDPALGRQAEATAVACPHYRWLGGLPHARARDRIQRAHVLVHTSRMEGGAHVIMEAALSGTPVLASRVPGNVGMLGEDYAGYFAAGDADDLVAHLRQCREGMAGPGGLLTHLQAQCAHRSTLFEPAAERAALCAVIDELL